MGWTFIQDGNEGSYDPTEAQHQGGGWDKIAALRDMLQCELDGLEFHLSLGQYFYLPVFQESWREAVESDKPYREMLQALLACLETTEATLLERRNADASR